MPLSHQNQNGLLSAFNFAVGQIFPLQADSLTEDFVCKVLDELTHDDFDANIFAETIEFQIDAIKAYLSQDGISPIDRITILTSAHTTFIKSLIETARNAGLIDDEIIKSHSEHAFQTIGPKAARN